jgi:hypothetical protein
LNFITKNRPIFQSAGDRRYPHQSASRPNGQGGGVTSSGLHALSFELWRQPDGVKITTPGARVSLN